ncbi:MAG: DUF928 domain-containing protein [Calothrix sp. FI2-JRJ7]|jgi:hypothetical protein|nr:DUF928 domain-containing protein [Calothrix sp. FI2-JRJ7]
MKKLSYFTTLLISVAILMSLTEQVVFSQNQANKKVNFIQPILRRLPVNRGAPNDRRGAGSRGECPAVSMAPTGLMPIVTSNNSSYVLGNTETEYPTFWYYLPYQTESISSVKFALVDGDENLLTKEPIPVNISGIPGVISFTLPKTQQPLKEGQFYHTYLLIDCNPQSNSEDVVIEGLVQVVAPTAELKKRLQTATEREKVSIYAQQGYWQDAITTLGELRRQSQKDTTLIEDWKTLLNSAGLENIAAEPISPCCKPK